MDLSRTRLYRRRAPKLRRAAAEARALKVRASEARDQRIAALVRADLEAAGVMGRVAAVKAGLRSPFFQRALHAAIDLAERDVAPKSTDDVREIILELLRCDGIDTADVLLKISWDPKTRALGVNVGPGVEVSIAAVQKAKQAVELAEVSPS